MAPALDVGAFNASSNRDVCFSSTCVDAAASILNYMDMNIDPCSDFFQYTCGNWIKDAVVPEEVTDFGSYEVESRHYEDQFRVILNGNYNDLLTATKSRSSFQVNSNDSVKLDELNFKVVQNYYESCVNVESHGKEALSSFYSDLNQLTHEATQQRPLDSTKFHLTEKAMEIISYPASSGELSIEVGGLFTMDFIPSDDDRSKMTISVYPTSSFYSDDDTAPLAKQNSTVLRIASSLLGSQNNTKRDHDRLSILEDAGLKMMTDAEINSTVNDAISVQNRLFQLTQESSNWTIYSIKELSDAFTFIDWQAMIDANVPSGRNVSGLSVEMYNTNYFQEINDPTRKLDKDAILNYLIVNKMYHESPRLDSQTRRYWPDSPHETRSHLCVGKVLNKLNLVSGRFYSMISFDGESDRLKIGEMAAAIKESLGNRIKNANWLDKPTRESAMKKLAFIQESIGYSTSSPDQRSPKDIHSYLRGLKADMDNFYDNEKAVNRWTLQVYWDTIGRTVSPTEWIGVTNPQVVNAFYMRYRNSIFINAAFSQKPLYDALYPDYMNYAGLGATLGHEYSHAFDNKGARYDEFGIAKDWWSENTKTEYQKKSQCFIDQYSKTTVTDEGKKFSVNGSTTLGENIADNEGLFATYDAYLKLKSSGKGYNPKLPGLQEFTPEALFFINAGRSFCSKILPGYVEDWLEDVHAPDSVRANSFFQNNKDFADVFSCPIGSKMNPETKCKIW